MARHTDITDYEVSLIKKMLDMKIPNQKILGYINNCRGDVEKHINNGRITDIKQGKIGKDIPLATQDEVESFMQKYGTFHGDSEIDKILQIKHGYLLCEENEEIEFKETFSGFKNNTRLITTIHAMANNKGGMIIFGIKEMQSGDNKKYKISGVDSEQLKKFNVDNKEISNQLNAAFGEHIEFQKIIKSIEGKDICVLKILESKNKPIIDSGGKIYYRYNAQNQTIKKLDLLRMLKERDMQELSNTFYKHIKTILKNGVENSAILNVLTGDVEGKSGNFLISEDLLPNIAFIKEGHFVEKSGAPAIVVRGNVESISADGIVVTHDVLKSIDDKYIYEVFFLQKDINKQDAITCLETMSKFQTSLLPMRYFAKKAEMDKDGLVQFLESIARDTTKKNFVNKKIERLRGDEPKKSETINEFKEKINNKNNLLKIIKKDGDIGKISVAIMSYDKEEIDKIYILSELRKLYNYCVQHNKNIQISNIRKAIAYIDRIFFE